MFEELEQDLALGLPRASASSTPGTMSQQVFVYSSRRDADGKTHEERYRSASFTDVGRGVHEHRQMYRNSAGAEKVGHARILGNRGKKTVVERNRQGDERQSQILRGMDEGEVGDFDRDWATNTRQLKF